MTKTTTESSQPTNRPTHIAYWVKDRGEDKKGVWRQIGVAWEHSDKKGFNVVLDLQPLDGRITLRVPDEKEK